MTRKKQDIETGLEKKYAVKMKGDILDTILPDGWIGVYHTCGAIVYLHRETRVVTWSRPYAITKETSLKKHNIPLMSIPCLHQKRAMGQYMVKQAGKRSCPMDTEPSAKVRKTEEIVVNGINDEPVESKKCPLALNEMPSNKCNGELVENFSSSTDINAENKNIPHVSNGIMSNEIHKLLSNGIPEPNEIAMADDRVGMADDRVNHVSLADNENSIIVDEGAKSNGMETTQESTATTPETDVESNSPTLSSLNSNGVEVTELMPPPPPPSPPPYNPLEDPNSTDPNLVTPMSMYEYVGQLFEFGTLTNEEGKIPVFTAKEEQSDVPEDVMEKKFITDGKTPFQILNEYCQRELKSLPSISKIERHSQHDFTIEILIKNFKYGIATGDTLREAKHNAAAATLNILDYTVLGEEETSPTSYLAIFDKIPSHDPAVLPNVEEFSAMGVKYPYDLLVHLLDRNFSPDFEESGIELNVENIDERMQKFQIKYKEHMAEGQCENWKQVKQIAAQAFIQVLYPDLKNWGSVIRLMECHADLLQSRQAQNESKLMKPGKCIIHVLRQEMRKIASISA